MQTILGSGGAVGIALAKELRNYSDKIRLVSRHPKKVQEGDELFAADLLEKERVMQAVKGSDIVYLTAGLKYSAKIWERDWPVIIQNVIYACLVSNTKLVFFDNVYMYAPYAVTHMTEESPVAPATRKGKVRAEIAQMLFDAMKEKGLTAMIARSADFYGKDATTGILNISVIDNYKKNTKAFWQSDADKIHSITYIPDAAKALAILGNTPEAFGQVWHLPTSAEKWTGMDFINFTAKEMNVKPRFYILSKFMISLIGIFSPMVKELKEMQYQNDQDYFFDSSKFEKMFSIKPTGYEEGIKESIE